MYNFAHYTQWDRQMAMSRAILARFWPHWTCGRLVLRDWLCVREVTWCRGRQWLDRSPPHRPREAPWQWRDRPGWSRAGQGCWPGARSSPTRPHPCPRPTWQGSPASAVRSKPSRKKVLNCSFQTWERHAILKQKDKPWQTLTKKLCRRQVKRDRKTWKFYFN